MINRIGALNEFYDCASLFQFGFCLVGCVFGGSFEHLAVSSLRQFLGFFQPETGQLTDNFDGIDFLRAGVFDNHIKFALFFHGLCTGSITSRNCASSHRDRRGSACNGASTR